MRKGSGGGDSRFEIFFFLSPKKLVLKRKNKSRSVLSNRTSRIDSEMDSEKSEYEKKRDQNIADNLKYLRELGLIDDEEKKAKRSGKSPPPTSKQRDSSRRDKEPARGRTPSRSPKREKRRKRSRSGGARRPPSPRGAPKKKGAEIPPPDSYEIVNRPKGKGAGKGQKGKGAKGDFAKGKAKGTYHNLSPDLSLETAEYFEEAIASAKRKEQASGTAASTKSRLRTWLKIKGELKRVGELPDTVGETPESVQRLWQYLLRESIKAPRSMPTQPSEPTRTRRKRSTSPSKGGGRHRKELGGEELGPPRANTLWTFQIVCSCRRCRCWTL